MDVTNAKNFNGKSLKLLFQIAVKKVKKRRFFVSFALLKFLKVPYKMRCCMKIAIKRVECIKRVPPE